MATPTGRCRARWGRRWALRARRCSRGHGAGVGGRVSAGPHAGVSGHGRRGDGRRSHTRAGCVAAAGGPGAARSADPPLVPGLGRAVGGGPEPERSVWARWTGVVTPPGAGAAGRDRARPGAQARLRRRSESRRAGSGGPWLRPGFSPMQRHRCRSSRPFAVHRPRPQLAALAALTDRLRADSEAARPRETAHTGRDDPKSKTSFAFPG